MQRLAKKVEGVWLMKRKIKSLLAAVMTFMAVLAAGTVIAVVDGVLAPETVHAVTKLGGSGTQSDPYLVDLIYEKSGEPVTQLTVHANVGQEKYLYSKATSDKSFQNGYITCDSWASSDPSILLVETAYPNGRKESVKVAGVQMGTAIITQDFHFYNYDSGKTTYYRAAAFVEVGMYKPLQNQKIYIGATSVYDIDDTYVYSYYLDYNGYLCRQSIGYINVNYWAIDNPALYAMADPYGNATGEGNTILYSQSSSMYVAGLTEGTGLIAIDYNYCDFYGNVWNFTDSAVITVVPRVNYQEETDDLTGYAVATGALIDISAYIYSKYDEDAKRYVQPTIVWDVTDKNLAAFAQYPEDPSKLAVAGITEGRTQVALAYSYELVSGTYVYYSVADLDITNPSLPEVFGVNIHDSNYRSPMYVTGASEYSKGQVIWEATDGRLNASYSQSDKAFRLGTGTDGFYAFSAVVDGRTLYSTVFAIDVYFSRAANSVDVYMDKNWHEGKTMLTLYPKESATLTLNGLDPSLPLVWTSSDEKVATVSNGKVTGKGNGYCTISASINGLSVTYEVGVAQKECIQAVRYEIKHLNDQYSQSKRMQEGYYDCSSAVWRAYADAGVKLGGVNSWAPTAADLAKWCEKNNYAMTYGSVPVEKLLPGDLIFSCERRGDRYRGIDHVDMHVGLGISFTIRAGAGVKDWNYKGGTIYLVARPVGGTTSITALDAASKKTTVKWTRMFGCTGYEIYRSTSKNGTYTRVDAVKGDKKLSYADTTTKKGTTYYYKVRPYWTYNGSTFYGKYSAVESIKAK